MRRTLTVNTTQPRHRALPITALGLLALVCSAAWAQPAGAGDPAPVAELDVLAVLLGRDECGHL